MRILIADTDSVAVNYLVKVLEKSSYAVDHVRTADEALNMFKHYDYDLFITELNLADLPGEELIRQLRRSRIATPVMVLSARMDSSTKVAAFSAGADDYVTKPFDINEAQARIQALTRRAYGISEPRLRVGPLELDLESRMVSVNGHFLHLTSKEYSILELLLLRKGAVLTKDMFLNHLYGGIDEPEMKIIDVFICKLRRKLQRFGAEHMITTVWGRGYILQDPAAISNGANHVAPQPFSDGTPPMRQAG
ncbi:response regulator transcription factor [Bombella favorum]|uniref:DNA-binding response regulator n=1 Tax=Bombella favorum TaxID=2039164 RepID=A0ABR5ZLY9_9PROT|nr:response regulator transcription factor [Bombella favorum]MBA5725344.1 DNA-binding response regulator [Bombella favorum]